MGRIPAGKTRRRKKLFFFLVICVVLGAIFGVSLFWGAPVDLSHASSSHLQSRSVENNPLDLNNPNPHLGDAHRQTPLIFVGGMPRSGTTLMRAMLDAHPSVRCGEETRVIPRILQMRNHWARSQKETLRLEEAGLTSTVIDAAISAFVYEIIVRHGDPAPRLCNKDPFTIKSAEYLLKLFPKSKFIFMIRDPRATVHSIISRKVTITGFDLTNFRQCLEKWNSAVKTMNSQCETLGPDKCLPIHYEQLVLHPKRELEKTLNFLGITWDDVVLHHEKLINKPGGVSLSKVERSSDQVIKPVNMGALKKWVGHVPKDVEDDMADIAPMMKVFGYDPNDRDPSYGEPDPHVAAAA